MPYTVHYGFLCFCAPALPYILYVFASDSVDRVDADRGVAPLATVGSEGTSRSRVHSPSVGRGLLQEVDEELGYPAANIIEYWRCKERKLNCMRSNMSAHDTVHRRHMVDWLSELSEELRLQPITTHR
jgi:hypothetical protein